jgi:hypothetical protein
MSFLDDPDFNDICTGLFDGPVICEITKVDKDYKSKNKGTAGVQVLMSVTEQGMKYDREKWGDPAGLLLEYIMWEPHAGQSAKGQQFCKKSMKEFTEALENPTTDTEEWIGQKVLAIGKIEEYEGRESTKISKVYKL